MKSRARAVLLALLCIAPAHGTPATARPALEEILVTARRREEPLQSVPMSVTVLSGERLEWRQVADVSELQFAAPGLTVAPIQTSRQAAGIAMRGHFERDVVPTVDPAVGLYLDGVYIARVPGANLRLLDVERVEVLRGPQGTLFGRNTIGGALNIIPRQPAAGTSAIVRGGFGNQDSREGMLVLNAPVAGAAVRLTASHEERGGLARSTLLGRDIADDRTDFARAQLRIAPASRWDLNLALDYTHSRSGSQWMTLAGTFPRSAPLPLASYVAPFARQIPSNRAGGGETSVWGVSATFTTPLARATFKSIIAYRSLDIEASESDQDGTPYDIGAIIERRDRQEQISQELQLYGDAFGTKVEWIGGLYYFEEDGTFGQRFSMLAPLTFDPVEAQPWGAASNESLAVYAQATWSLASQLRLTAGVRYNEDRRQLTSRNLIHRNGVQTCRIELSLLDVADICQATLPGRPFSYVPFTMGLDYTPAQSTMLYAKLSRGHRAGGYNLRGVTTIDLGTFEPERLTSWEIGAKTEQLGSRLRINVALYRSQFEDIQLNLREVVPGDLGQPFATTVIRNAGEARIIGGELEAQALFGPLRTQAALAITRARFTRVDPRATDITVDSEFLMTPRTAWSVAADLPVTSGFGEIGLHADYAWRDTVAFWFDRDSPARQEAYGLLNGMISFRPGDSRFELSVWGRNLTDRAYFLRAFETDLILSAIPGERRTYGVSLKYDFSRE